MIRVFRGNCKQVALQEAETNASKRVMKTDHGSNTPLFSVQDKFTPPKFYNMYWVRTDIEQKKLLPDIYRIKYYYDILTDYGEISMDKEVVELFERTMPELMAKFEEVNNGKKNSI